jgi:hypothetical protein
MKKQVISFLIAFSTICTCLYSQTLLTPPPLDGVKNSQYTNRNPNEFILGWNWSAPGKKLDEALMMNTYHDMYLNPSILDYKDSLYIFAPLGNSVTGGRNQWNVLNSHSLQLEPTISIDSTNNFQPRVGDTTGSVFGFGYKNLNVGSIPSSGDDFNRFVLNKNSLTTDSAVVLNNIWNGSILKWLDYDGGENTIELNEYFRTNHTTLDNQFDIDNYYPYNGKRYYVSINLRAINPSDVELHLQDTILSLEMPYTLTHYRINDLSIIDSSSFGVVRFDSVPQANFAHNFNIQSTVSDTYYQGFRGASRKLKFCTTKPQKFYITGEMLKNLNTTLLGNSITLSACATFNGVPEEGGTELVNNPLIKNDWWENGYRKFDYITKFDVKVIYYGNLDVALDWIRIETPQCQKLIRGGFDDTINSTANQYLSQCANHPTHPKVSRFYATDEALQNQWMANRYYNYLLDTLATLETFVEKNPSAHFLHATGFREYWNGNNIYKKNYIANCFYNYGILDDGNNQNIHNFSKRLLGTNFGSSGRKRVSSLDPNILEDSFIFDSLNSGYETLLYGTYDRCDGPLFDNNGTKCPLPSQANWTNSTLLDFYNNVPNNIINQESWGTLYTAESDLYLLYNDRNILFNTKPWFANLWITSESWRLFDMGNNNTIVGLGSNENRPLTDSELNNEVLTPIILGAKGLIYYFKSTYDWTENNASESIHQGMPQVLGLQKRDNTSSLNGLDYVLDDNIGGDYIIPFTTVNDPNFDDHYVSNPEYRFDILGVDQNHHFIGIRSLRYQLYKINRWIKFNEPELLNLKLVAWLGVGHRKWYTQDIAYGNPELGDTLLNSICILSILRTHSHC